MSWFDWAVLVLWIAYFPIPFFWLLVHPFTKFWRRRRARAYLGLGLLVLLAFAAAFVLTRGFWFAERLSRGFFTYALGAALLALELVIEPKVGGALGAAIMMGRAEVDPVQFPPRLVDTGIYARLRHPRYLGAMSFLIGLSVLAASTRLMALAALSVPLYYLVTVFEDRELAARLGEPFLAYRKRVPRFIPRLRL